MDDTGLVWYSNYVGGDSGLGFILHLKIYKGFILNISLAPLYLNNDHVYANISVTLFMSLFTLKKQNPPDQTKPLSAAW